MYMEVPTMELRNRTRTVLFIELHGGFGDPVPGIVKIESMLQQLQNYTQHYNSNNEQFGASVVTNSPRKVKKKPISFVFTTLRDPLKFYISYFKFFKHPGCKTRYCSFPIVQEINEASLLESSIYNHQCFYLYKHYNITTNTRSNYIEYSNLIKYHNSEALEACRLTHQYMYQYMDYISITETLSSETLPLLFSMLMPRRNLSRKRQKQRMGRVTFQSVKYQMDRFLSGNTIEHNKNSGFDKNWVSPNGLRYLRELSSYDQFMYDCAIKNFNLLSSIR